MLNQEEILRATIEIMNRAIREDVRDGDRTCLALPLDDARARATLRMKEKGIVSGLIALKQLDKIDALPNAGAIDVKLHHQDASALETGTELATLEGPARSLLILERSLLNLCSRLSGIATQTKRFVDAVAHAQRSSEKKTAVCDTRKTTPGLRMLEKYAVECGGGEVHRIGLFDEYMIKENHLALSELKIPDAIARLRKRDPELRLTCEVESIEELKSALSNAPDCIMLDNFSHAEIVQAIELRKQLKLETIPFEVSGGVTLDTVASYAELGVERISVGALTHSACALDLNLKMQPVSKNP